MTKDKIYRINELAKKSKTAELSEKEKEEQSKLRNEYLKDIKSNFINTLESVVIIDENDKKEPIKKCK